MLTWLGLATAAYLTSLLIGRRRTVYLLCMIAFVAAIAPIKRQGLRVYRHFNPLVVRLELTLKLARRQWRVGEEPWYRLTLTNLAPKSVYIDDQFWHVQAYLDDNTRDKHKTYFQVIGPDGKEIHPSFFWGIHGEFMIWANDCGGGKPCEHIPDYRRGVRELAAGGTLTATPTMAAPLRAQRGWELADARIPPNATPDQVKALEKLWRIQGEDLGKTGKGKDKLDPYGIPEVIPGFRILEGYHFDHPGRYRIKAIFDPRTHAPPVSADDEISMYRAQGWKVSAEEEREIGAKWQKESPGDLEFSRKMRADWEECHSKGYEENRSYLRICRLIESNTVELEIVR